MWLGENRQISDKAPSDYRAYMAHPEGPILESQLLPEELLTDDWEKFVRVRATDLAKDAENLMHTGGR